MSKVIASISGATGIPIGWMFTLLVFLIGPPLCFAIWLATTISTIQRDIREMKGAMWTETNHEYWALELQRRNPQISVPLNPSVFQKKLANNSSQNEQNSN